VDKHAVAGDEKTGRAGCDDREVIDVESVKEQDLGRIFKGTQRLRSRTLIPLSSPCR